VTGQAGPLLITGARIVSGGTITEDGWVRFAAGRVAARGTGAAPASDGEVIDAGGGVLTPGFVDVHVHGGAGAQVSGDDPAAVAGQVAAIAAHHLRHGTTALVPTSVAESPDRLVAAVRGIAQAIDAGGRPGTATVLGAHLEGPWLAPGRAGAHDPAHLRSPDPAEFAALLDASGGTIRLLTIAPELPGALDLIRIAVAAGVTVSIGHTDADAEQVRRAVDAGARHATHLFNAMPEMTHRAPGPVGALLADDRVTVEIIADGHHLHPDVLTVVGAAARGRVAAITDAMAATGLSEGAYRLGRLDVDVAEGRVTLARRDTLAGSVLTLDRAVRTLIAAGWSLADAVAAATRVPADSVRATTKGRLEPGADADLVVLDDDLQVAAVLSAGAVAHDPHGLFAEIVAE
jgi:N-acetylglucosamine-6-phosphate deacetylase